MGIEPTQQPCKGRSPALVHAPPLTVVEQMEIESITGSLPEIFASLGTCCPKNWAGRENRTLVWSLEGYHNKPLYDTRGMVFKCFPSFRAIDRSWIDTSRMAIWHAHRWTPLSQIVQKTGFEPTPSGWRPDVLNRWTPFLLDNSVTMREYSTSVLETFHLFQDYSCLSYFCRRGGIWTHDWCYLKNRTTGIELIRFHRYTPVYIKQKTQSNYLWLGYIF